MSEAPKACIADLSVEEGVETEKCVVAQYRTTLDQKLQFQNLLKNSPRDKIPIEWVIDIADESNGWFYGTAYHFDDTTQMLHVMVPDKISPSFDGNVILDHRTVHLIECVDGRSDALFNKIVRDSIVKVKWDVEWFEEDASNPPAAGEDVPPNSNGKWVASSARYYIRMANQLLVEDENFGHDTRGFVMLTADLNVKLHLCHKGRGQDDFNRLVNEGITQSTPEALESVRLIESFAASVDGAGSSPLKSASPQFRASGDDRSGSGSRRLADENVPSVRKLAELSRDLRESIADLADEQTKIRVKTSRTFKSFVLDGDLDAGLLLFNEFDRSQMDPDDDEIRSRKGQETLEVLAEESLFLARKLEKGMVKLHKAGADSGAAHEVESLKKMYRKLKEDLLDKERELELLRSRLA